VGVDLPPTRRLTPDDAAAWATLRADAEVVDRTGEHFSADDVAEELADRHLVVEGLGDGDRLLATTTMLPRGESEGFYLVQVSATVAPAHRGRGVGTALTRGLLDRALAVAAEQRPDLPSRVAAVVRTGDPSQEGVLTEAGMHPHRWTFAMRTGLDDVGAAPALREGYRLRAYDEQQSEPLRLAHNTAFAGHHPGFTPWAEEVWRHWVTGSRSFRGDLTWLVVPAAGDEIVGYVVTHEFAGHAEVTGRREAHVARIGTHPEHRGRGIAAALLGHALHRYAAAGYDEASLHVDTENPSGALGIYRRAGFEVESTWTTYVVEQPARTT
jgi:ribosomal protein S18 acetylase RimI-like enzyme